MTIEQLYPYWPDAHQDLCEQLSFLTEEQLDAKPHEKARSIRQTVLRFVNDERWWISHLIARHPVERVNASECATAALLVDALEATREASRRIMETISPEGLRAVRTVPADPEINRPEMNQPVSWLIWHVVESEIACLAQIRLRLEDSKNAKKS
jgi:uncharacterized damage-inducible protein DinB